MPVIYHVLKTHFFSMKDFWLFVPSEICLASNLGNYWINLPTMSPEYDVFGLVSADMMIWCPPGTKQHL